MCCAQQHAQVRHMFRCGCQGTPNSAALTRGKQATRLSQQMCWMLRFLSSNSRCAYPAHRRIGPSTKTGVWRRADVLCSRKTFLVFRRGARYPVRRTHAAARPRAPRNTVHSWWLWLSIRKPVGNSIPRSPRLKIMRYGMAQMAG